MRLPGFCNASPVAASSLYTRMLCSTLCLSFLYSQLSGLHPQRSYINVLSHLRPAVPEDLSLAAAAPISTLAAIFGSTRGTRREEDELVEDDAGERGGVCASVTSRDRLHPRSMGARRHPGEANTSAAWLARPGVHLNLSGLWPIWRPHLATTAVRIPVSSPASMVGDRGVDNPSTRCGCDSLIPRLWVSSLSINRFHGVVLGFLS